MYLYNILIILVILVNSGCQFTKKQSGGGSSVPKTDLEGTWRSNCIANALKNGYVTITHIFSGSNYKNLEVSYSDQGCEAKTQTVEGEASFETDEATAEPKPWQYTLGKVFLTIHSQIIDKYNDAQFCDLKWSRDQANEVTGKVCYFTTQNQKVSFPFPQAGKIVYGIYQIKNNNLYLGSFDRQHDGTSESKRPVNLGKNSYSK